MNGWILHIDGPVIRTAFGDHAIDPSETYSCLIRTAEGSMDAEPVVTGWKRCGNADGVTSVSHPYDSERRH